MPVRLPTIQEFLSAKSKQEFWIGVSIGSSVILGFGALLLLLGLLSLNTGAQSNASSNQIGGAGVVAGDTFGNIVVNDKDSIAQAFEESMNAAIDKQVTESQDYALNPMSYFDKTIHFTDINIEVVELRTDEYQNEAIFKYAYVYNGQDSIGMVTLHVAVYQDGMRVGNLAIPTGSVNAEMKEYNGLAKADLEDLIYPLKIDDRIKVERVLGM